MREFTGTLHANSALPPTLVEQRSLDAPTDAAQKFFEGNPASDLPTLVHRNRHFAQSIADNPVFTHVLGEPGKHQQLTFADLDSRARQIAGEIQAKGGVGKTVLVVLNPGVDYAAAIYGCMYARAIAVPVYPPQMLRLQHTLPRLRAIIENAQAKLMISDRETVGDSVGSLYSLSDDAAILVDEIDSDAASKWDGQLPDPEQIAVLQYTSGSTGNPRGVVLRHTTMMNNMYSLVHRFQADNVCCVQWIPPYHDMGLVGGILVPVYMAQQTVILNPADFVRDPLLWLRSIQYYKGTSNGSPNFGYELCVRKIKEKDCDGLDLSSWKVAVAGAEPVRADTLRRFTEKFAPYGFSPNSFCPSYGMAETTVIATGSRLGSAVKTFAVDSAALQSGKIQLPVDDAPATTLVGSGTAVANMEVEIVDRETKQRSPQGTIGEIWVRGTSVADGYYRAPEKTAESFGARLEGSPHCDYLRTGDLGVLIDNELVVTGRCKELIIIAGKNLYPHDVESTVQGTSEAFKADSGVAFGFDTGTSEELVVIQEVWRPKKFDTDELLRGAVTAIVKDTQVTPHAVVLVRTGTIPKTSSGKLQRSDARELFLKNDLPEIARWQPNSGSISASATQHQPPRTETEQKLATIWGELLGVDEIGREDDFFHLGGGSLLVVQLLTRVQETMGAQLDLTSLFGNSTLAQFALQVENHQQSVSKNPIRRSPIADSDQHPLTFAQQRFWLLNQLGQTDAFLHVPVWLELNGNVDKDKLQDACNQLLQLHPALRTSFAATSESISQTICKDAELTVETLTAGEDWGKQRNEFVSRSFDLSRPPLMRVAMTQRSEASFRIDFVFHHIICDAGSVEILLGDLQKIYNQQTPPTPSLRYVDFAAWEQTPQQQSSLEQGTNYWRNRLTDIPSQITLPSPDRSIAPTDNSMLTLDLDPELTRNIQQAALAADVTSSMLFLVAFEHVLARYAGCNDIAISIPTSNRPASDLDRTIGCFVNPFVYRKKTTADEILADSIALARKNLLADLENARVPFQKVVEAVEHDRTSGRMPLSQVMFLYQPPLRTIDSLGDATVTSITPDYSAVTAYDLSLIVHPTSQFQLSLVVGENVCRQAAQRILDATHNVVRQLASSELSNLEVRQLEIPAPNEKRQLENTRQGAKLNADASVLRRLSDHAQDRPTDIAIQDDSQSISYQELEAASNRLAAALRNEVSPGDRVGIRLPRSISMVVSLLGIWKSQCAYVPLDPKFPKSRLDSIVADAGVYFTIDCSTFERLMSVQTDSAELNFDLDSVTPESLAYVIYTSGSTGKPKGVAIEHRSVTNLLTSFAAEPGFACDDTLFAITTLAFDISVLELLLPIWSGGKCRVAAHTAAETPEELIEAFNASSATHFQSTPSTIRLLIASGWSPPRGLQVWCGGEPMMPDVAEELLDSGCELWNVYGPTETTVWSALQRIESSEDITIGHPVANTQLLVLDSLQLECPLGVVGELWIGGDGLARGYWNDTTKTDDRFVQIDGRRLYKTGDQVHRRQDGQLVFLARNDRQVKLRGFRVELDEIEAVLQQHDSVARAAVILSSGTSPTLIAFCQVETEESDEIARSIRDHVGSCLPNYMIPLVKCLKQIPRTSAGKTDYKALPVALALGDHGPDVQLPQTPMEKKLEQAWKEVLGRETIGRNENFFDLGGNSLMAAQLFSRLRERLGVSLPLREVYEQPTIAGMADLIVHWQSKNSPSEISELLEQIEALSEEDALKTLVNDSEL